MLLNIEVAYATPEHQQIIALSLPEHSTLEQAIVASGILEDSPEINLANNAVGVFGKVYPLSQTIKQGDRIEIYRPLQLDPKEARRQRATKG